MSVTVECFFDCDEPPDVIRDAIAAELGCTFRRDENDNLGTKFWGMWLYLDSPNTHGFSVDYGHCIYTHTSAGSGARPIQLAATALLPFALTECLLVPRCNLLFDAELLLAEYELRRGGLHDRISDREVTYPEHLGIVAARLEQLRPKPR